MPTALGHTQKWGRRCKDSCHEATDEVSAEKSMHALGRGTQGTHRANTTAIGSPRLKGAKSKVAGQGATFFFFFKWVILLNSVTKDWKIWMGDKETLDGELGFLNIHPDPSDTQQWIQTGRKDVSSHAIDHAKCFSASWKATFQVTVVDRK